VDDQQLATAIARQVAEFAPWNDEQLYLLLSQDFTRKANEQLLQKAVAKLDPEQRRKFAHEGQRGAGLYGPVSFLFGKIDDRTLHILTHPEPTVGNGKGWFESNWKIFKNHFCDEWHYCEKRKEYSDDLSLITAITAIMVEKMSLEVGIAAAAVLLAFHRGPRFICDCQDSAGAGRADDGVEARKTTLSLAVPAPSADSSAASLGGAPHDSIEKPKAARSGSTPKRSRPRPKRHES
jgi:hypothetical protein